MSESIFSLVTSVADLYELSSIRLNGDKSPFVPFTTDVEKVPAHYCTYGVMREHIRCNQALKETCTLCKIGNQVKQRILLPLYDPIADTVAVLPMADTSQPGSLFPQMIEVLKGFDPDSAPPLVTIWKPTNMTFKVSAEALPDKAKKGEEAIARFVEEQSRTPALVESTVRVISNAELEAISEIQNHLSLLGG